MLTIGFLFSVYIYLCLSKILKGFFLFCHWHVFVRYSFTWQINVTQSVTKSFEDSNTSIYLPSPSSTLKKTHASDHISSFLPPPLLSVTSFQTPYFRCCKLCYYTHDNGRNNRKRILSLFGGETSIFSTFNLINRLFSIVVFNLAILSLVFDILSGTCCFYAPLRLLIELLLLLLCLLLVNILCIRLRPVHGSGFFSFHITLLTRCISNNRNYLIRPWLLAIF